MGTASSRKWYCGEGLKQEAPLKVSPIEGAKSKDSLLDSGKGKTIQAETLQVKYGHQGPGSGFKSNSESGMHGEIGPDQNILDSGSPGQPGCSNIILTKVEETQAGTS